VVKKSILAWLDRVLDRGGAWSIKAVSVWPEKGVVNIVVFRMARKGCVVVSWVASGNEKKK
jgi:hypothetical protein